MSGFCLCSGCLLSGFELELPHPERLSVEGIGCSEMDSHIQDDRDRERNK